LGYDSFLEDRWVRANYFLLPLFVAVLIGCGRGAEPADSDGGSAAPAGTAPSRPRAMGDAFTRANFVRVQPGMTLRDVELLFGPTTTSADVGGGETEYRWGPKDRQLLVNVKRGKVQWVRWPGKEEHDRRQMLAGRCLHGLARSLEEYALKHGSRFPPGFADLKLIGGSAAELPELVRSGEIVVPWGETANQMIWAWWKDTPEVGGPFIRYDLKLTENGLPQEFAKQKGVKLTAKTIPAENAVPWKPHGEPGFFLSTTFMFPLWPCMKDATIPPPRGLSDYPVFMVRGDMAYAGLKAVESGAVVVRWDRHPAHGLYMYPNTFPRRGGWAIVDGGFRTYTADQAEALVAKDK